MYLSFIGAKTCGGVFDNRVRGFEIFVENETLSLSKI